MKIKNKWLNEIQSHEELPNLYQIITDLIGIENTLKLAELLGGETIYFPSPTALSRLVRNKRIQEEFNGYNERSLARKYNLSTKRISQLVRDVKDVKKEAAK